MNHPSNPQGTPGVAGTGANGAPQLSPESLPESDPTFPARIFSVLVNDPNDPKGEVWQLMSQVPGAPILIIVSILPDEGGGYEIYALPAEGTKPHESKQAFIFTLSESIVRQTMTVVDRSAWEEILKPAQESTSDEWVAGLVSKWTSIPEDMIIEHLEEAREELEEIENGEGEPGEPSETGDTAAALTNGTAGSPS